MARDKPVRITVSKLDAAKRQIETAISLWFHDADIVSIHTLVAAGHQVCHGILKHQKIKVSMIFNLELLPEDARIAYKRFILAPENFFKHGDDDPNPYASIDLVLGVTEVYLVDAIYLFHNLNGGVVTPTMKAFSTYFEILNPHLLKEEFSGRIREPLWIEMGKVPKATFYKAFLQTMKRLGR